MKGGPQATELVVGVRPRRQSAAETRAQFRALLGAGFVLAPAGDAANEPERLLTKAYVPSHRIDLFDATFFLSNQRESPEFRFFVGYVLTQGEATRPRKLVPRIFYKDSSLVWRVATHLIRTENENWMGKGDVKWAEVDGEVLLTSAEETTNLPLELQTAFDVVSRAVPHTPKDRRACEWVLRRAPEHRLEPYADFAAPRRRAFANPRNRIHGGKPVAYFTAYNDPTSLRFVAGFEPDFARGVVEIDRLRSHIYGGEVRRLRILSTNRKIQYQFLDSAHQTWVIPPQPLTRPLSSFGVRTIDAVVHDDLCVPGYEYHFLDLTVDPPEFVTQIPRGFAGMLSTVDASRADASPWLDQLPVIQSFRRAKIRAPNARLPVRSP